MSEDQPEPTGKPDAATWKPLLGLSDEPGPPAELPVRTGTFYDPPEPETLLELTVIVPARNEEDCIGTCVESLVRQSEDVFELGRDWELIVVDDESTDRTAEIVRGFAGVTVLKASRLEKAGQAKSTPSGRRREGRAENGSCSPMPTPSTNRGTCDARCTRRRGTMWAC